MNKFMNWLEKREQKRNPIINCVGSNSTTNVVVGDTMDVYGSLSMIKFRISTRYKSLKHKFKIYLS